MWLPFKTNLIRQEFGLLGSGTLGSSFSEKQSEGKRDGEDTDVSHQLLLSLTHGKAGGAQRKVVSRLIYLIGSRDAYRSDALWVSVWIISDNYAIAKLSSDPAHLILSRGGGTKFQLMWKNLEGLYAHYTRNLLKAGVFLALLLILARYLPL